MFYHGYVSMVVSSLYFIITRKVSSWTVIELIIIPISALKLKSLTTWFSKNWSVKSANLFEVSTD